MARLPRLFVPDLAQHAVQRGAGGQAIAPDPEALDTLQTFLAEAVRSHGLLLHAYVLMPDHFHLLATGPEPQSLSRSLQSLGRRYVQYYNRRIRREGTLWEGRYRSCVVQSERYLLPCSRYVELNPLRSGLAGDPAHYPWSSYRHHVGVEACPFITDHAQYWALGNTPFERQAVYKQQAEQSLSDEDLRAIRKATLGGWGLGDDEFLERIELIAHRRTRPLSRGRPPKAARPQTD